MYPSQLGGFSSPQATKSFDSNRSSANNCGANEYAPVTVKQISESSISADGKFSVHIDGVDVPDVTLVGMVLDKAPADTHVNFTLDDGTGRINCQRWINCPFDSIEMKGIQNRMYVRVIGTVKNFHSTKPLEAFSVKPVTQFDEVTFHSIDCIHSHVLSTKSTMLNESILDYLQQPPLMKSDVGASTDEIFKKLDVPMDKFENSIRYLEKEGWIFTTIDKFHYKST